MSEKSSYKKAVRELEKSADEMLDRIKKVYGEIPYIYQKLRKDPEKLIGQFIKSNSVFRSRKSTLTPKMKELIALSAAVSQKCAYCIKVHKDVAMSMGATKEEILETVLISALTSETSTLAEALRAIDSDELPK